MKSFSLLTLLFLVGIQLCNAQERLPDGGGAVEVPKDDISEFLRSEIQQLLTHNIDSLLEAGTLSRAKSVEVELQWPLKSAQHLFDYNYHGISNFVDLNSEFPDQITDYTCGTRSYDLESGYNHAGTDFFTWPFSWIKMADDDVEIVAAASGVIVAKSDGNDDRSCSFNGSNWNAVYVRHADGSVAWYGHMKKNSTTEKAVGEQVEAGEFLGIVGSSGNSTGPHLHFELQDSDGNIVDPFKGECNAIEKSLWEVQRDYYDSSVNAVRTHGAGPVFNSCPTPAIPNLKDAFLQGDQIVNAGYYRDQLEGQTSFYSVIMPSGNTLWNWSHALSEVPHYAASYWWWSNQLPADAELGVWKYQISFLNEIYTHEFTVSNENTKPMAVTLQNPMHEAETKEDTEVLRWLPLADANEYELVISTDANFSEDTDQFTLTDRMYELNNLEQGITYFWRVRAKNTHGNGDWSQTWSFNTGVSTTSESSETNNIPSEYILSQNYPNPFNPTTQISYDIPNAGNVTLVVYNLLGKEVESLVHRVHNPGSYTVTFDAKNLPSGIYYYKLTAGHIVEMKPMTLIK